ncbi:MAG: hypothetical protein ACYCOO_02955 [Chitinophagaceae bacterium]
MGLDKGSALGYRMSEIREVPGDAENIIFWTITRKNNRILAIIARLELDGNIK